MKHTHDNIKQSRERADVNDAVESSHSNDAMLEARRAFILKYGALAAITPVALTLTMHSQKALASSCTECGP